MHRSIPPVFASLGLALALSGCVHLGTNVAGNFSCRAQAGRVQASGCQPLSEVDAHAIRELFKTEGAELAEPRQRVAVASANTVRIGERTLKVVFPAHVDASGTLHDEATVWTVVEAARWAGELRGGEVTQPKGTMRALRQSLKDRARHAADVAPPSDAAAAENPQPLNSGSKGFGEDSAPAYANPFTPSSPLALPSPGGEASADVTVSDPVAPAAGEFDMSPTPHVRAPRPLEEERIWPSAAAIQAAKTLKSKGNTDTGANASADAGANIVPAPKKEPK